MILKGVIFGACSFLILIGIFSQCFWSDQTLPGKGEHLQSVLPMEITGWEGRDLPLGATEAAEGQVEKILRYSDVYYREYSRSRATLCLYVAYWEPGAMPVQVVASHTPDQCWTNAGWSCVDFHDGAALPGLRSGASRVFVGPNNVRLNVVFWHIVGNDLYDFGNRFTLIPHPLKWWRDVAKQLVGHPQEQYFIRLTSNVPFDEIREDPGFQEVLTALRGVGLGDRGDGR